MSGAEYALYRYFDSADRLLYVGKSIDWERRRRQHRRHASWYALKKYNTVVYYACAEDLSRAEVIAIRVEKPLFNKVLHREWSAQSEGALARDLKFEIRKVQKEGKRQSLVAINEFKEEIAEKIVLEVVQVSPLPERGPSRTNLV